MTEDKQTAYLEQFGAVDNVSLYSQFAEYLRDAIHKGIFAGGEKMPSLRAIAKASGVNYYSTQLATEELLKEGLLYKSHGKGMYVRDYVSKSGIIGILVAGDSIGFSPFLHMTISYMGEQLNRLGHEVMTFYKYHGNEQAGGIPSHLENLITSNRLKALIALNLHQEDRPWFDHLTIPHYAPKYLSSQEDCIRFCTPLKELLESGKYKQPLLLFPRNPLYDHADSTVGKILRKGGIDATQYRCLEIYGGLPDKSFAKQAYDVLKQEIAASKHPDLLFVYPDDAIPGAVAALYESNIKIPEHLTLVCHRNKEIPIFSPFPVTYLESSVKNYADNILKQIIIH